MEIEELRKLIVESPKNAGGKRIYAPTVKAETLQLINQSSLSLAELCQSLDINIATVHSWIKAAGQLKKTNGSFKAIAVTEEPKPSEATLVLTSPAGFSLSGSANAIISVWRSIDASATR